VDIALLKTFLQVARTQHFGRAAESLFVTQSAVSARIKLLEGQLGVELFSRRRNDIGLTPAGQRLRRHAETIVTGWERARAEVALDPEDAWALAMGCPFDLWDILLRDWVGAMRRQAPRLVLQIDVGPGDALVQRLLTGVLDLAILFDPPRLPELLSRPLAEIPLVLVSSAPAGRPDEALDQGYLMVDWGSSFALSHAQHFPDLATPAARLNSGAMARDLMLDSGGAAYLALPAVQSELDQGRLYRVPGAPVITRSTFAACRPASQAREEVQQALESLPVRFRGGDRTTEPPPGGSPTAAA
jgi:DNA-binding transcriptional LysR family regulator